MQVILLEKVANLGNLGDIVKVKDGYARNFLIPPRRARRATEAAIKEFEAKRAELEKAAADKLAAAQSLGEKLAGKSSGDARRPASTAACSAPSPMPTSPKALTQDRLRGAKSQVRMPNGPLKTVGEHVVSRRRAQRRRRGRHGHRRGETE